MAVTLDHDAQPRLELPIHGRMRRMDEVLFGVGEDPVGLAAALNARPARRDLAP